MGAVAVLSWYTVGGWVALLPAAVLAWVLGRHVLPTLLARFDRAALRVVPPPGQTPVTGPLDAGQRAAWQALASWCEAGAGDGRLPWWRPGGIPQMERPLAVAVLCGGTPARQLALADAFSRARDGSDLLAAAPGRWARLLLRLRVKRDDALWWRARRADDPWDCGYLGCDVATRQALRDFRPRRATLLVAAGLPPPLVAQAQAELAANSGRFRHPVRLLRLESGEPATPHWAHGPGAVRIALEPG